MTIDGREIDRRLAALEQQWTKRLAGVRPARATGALVFYAWDEDEGADDDRVVVCIGSNYGQGEEEKMRSSDVRKPAFERRAKLGPWMANYRRAAARVRERIADWRRHGWLEGEPPPERPRYFVMTNLVPWITDEAWTSLAKNDVEAMLAAVPAHANHLDDLAAQFGEAFAVGHGIHDHTRAAVQEAARRWPNRMAYANLSFPQTPSDWNGERFTFGRRRRKPAG